MAGSLVAGRLQCGKECQFAEGYLMPDHVHILISIPPNLRAARNDSLAGIRPPQQPPGAKLPLAALPGRVGPLSGKQGGGLRVAQLADAQRDAAGAATRIVGKNFRIVQDWPK